MKTFLISSALFMALLLIFVFHFAYLSRVTGEMTAIAETLPEEVSEVPIASLSELREVWNSARCRIRISADASLLEEIESAIDGMYFAAETQNDFAFRFYKAQFFRGMESLSNIKALVGDKA